MSDLVERLRKGADDASLDCYAMCEEAADRIEALETALRASRLVLIEWGIDPKSRIVGVIDTALAPEQDK